jgi:CopG family transcriptional regulator/antitoxin EndoAI
MQRHTDQWTVSLPPPLSKQAMKVAKEESRTKSELVREALRDYLAKKDRFLGLRRQLSERLEAKGIRTMQDVENMIDELRAKK